MPQYLYGASIQGIQDFIFETNKLVEIIGASELVQKASTDAFKELLGARFKDDEHIIGAAGNIRYLFSNEDDCKEVVRKFPKHVAILAPGITISQAVVLVPDVIGQSHFTELEKRLGIQRNVPKPSFQTSCMVIERSRRTGKGAYKIVIRDAETNYLSIGETLKQDASSETRLTLDMTRNAGTNHRFNFPTDITEIVGCGEQKDKWLAVMHADGNGLGKLLLKMSQELNGKRFLDVYRLFSQQLDEATKAASQAAFKDTFQEQMVQGQKPHIIPMRPVLLGGDDLTIIIKGNRALDFTHAFLKHFETETKKHFAKIDWAPLKKGLTSCAGIAYIKPNYPFHYAVRLADELCKHAKKIAKDIVRDNDNAVPSSIMFHQVYSSFIGSYSETANRELADSTGRHRFDYGPYFLEAQENYATVDKLKNWMEKFSADDVPRTPLRTLVSYYVDDNQDEAEQYWQRVKSFNGESSVLAKEGFGQSVFLRREADKSYSPILDIIRMVALHYQPEKQA